MTHVISIQSQVVYGHVGNSAAVFPLQVKGWEVAAIPTVLLSNNPHYPTTHGKVLEADLVAELLQGLEERGCVDTARVLVTGYLGSVENGELISEFVARAVERNPNLIYVCDPVMGDDDLGLYVKEGLIDTFRQHLTPMASVITPNQYELELLAGHKARSAEGVSAAVRILSERGVRGAAVTGCVLDDTEPGFVETVIWSNGGLTRIPVQRLPIRPTGTGDLFTALLVAKLCEGIALAEAGIAATEEIRAVLERTHADASREMRITGFPFAAARHPKPVA
ncbi:pyridoxal kinase [Ochrobactrum vermis]|uniref:pyridoxal kinase n=1 Tax=Ochrobactrum vermis TaxID=1827297 RepID=A0ABU8PKX1_9HYPH|nr:pyridoxal kinase [Ochrobactrum vermis]PQZ24312.1 pyridoxal kinase [Ochrobactrum vermis]